MHLATLPSSTLVSGSVVPFWCMLTSESQSTLSAVPWVVCRLLFVSAFLRQCEVVVSGSACCFSVFCNAVCFAWVPASTVLGGPCARPSFCLASAAVRRTVHGVLNSWAAWPNTAQQSRACALICGTHLCHSSTETTDENGYTRDSSAACSEFAKPSFRPVALVSPSHSQIDQTNGNPNQQPKPSHAHTRCNPTPTQ